MTEITANYDETWKEAIGDYFESFLTFFYPEIHQQIDWTKPPISLDKELEQITASAETEKRYADKLFQVWLLDNQWEDLTKSHNLFAIVVMAHLKTKSTTSNLTEREQWKWNLTRLFYEKGYNRL
jgi:DNA-binding transcriptional regulator GbsR (MarR family)